MPQNELRELVKACNPVPNPAVLLREESDLRILFEQVMHRADDPQTSMYLLDENVDWRSNMETNQEVIDLALSPEHKEKRWWPAAVIAAVAIAAIALLVFAVQPDDPNNPVATDDVAISTTLPVADASEDPFSDPAAVVDAYFAAHNAGDADTALALLTADATASWMFGRGPFESFDLERLTWDIAQGKLLTPPTCTLAETQPEQGTTLSCDHDSLGAAEQAVDGTPIPTTTSFTITSLGISEINESYGATDYTTVGYRFRTWMRANHPDDADRVGFRTWTSVEDARSSGALYGEYAQEWATYLEANGCAYIDGC